MTVTGRLDPAIARSVTRVDAWRQSAKSAASDSGSYKEWMHFCVCLADRTHPTGHLLVNLNVTDSLLAGARTRNPRLIALGYLGDWTGTLETFGDDAVSGGAGGLDLFLGRNGVSWRDGAYVLVLDAAEIAADLRLRPLVPPTVPSQVSFGGRHSIAWVVVPRLEATGWVRIGGRTLRLERASAYHDHNWGHFRWGGDLAWEWGFVNPADARCPFSVVFARVSDRGRHCTFSQSVLLWRRDSLIRTFQDREVRMTMEGAHPGPRPFTLPRVASLLLPGTSSGVPSRVLVEARGRDEQVTIDLVTSSKARIGIPSDTDPFRLVVLNETCGEARVKGSTRAADLDFAGPAVMEFVRG